MFDCGRDVPLGCLGGGLPNSKAFTQNEEEMALKKLDKIKGIRKCTSCALQGHVTEL